MDNDQISIYELVLKVNKNVDQAVWNESKYYDFIDALCDNRQYQKNAIFETLRYLLAGEYQNLEELAEENFQQNSKLKDAHGGNFPDLKKQLHFPDKLACSLDLATGTGKSYVLYALAVIMLAEKKVDQVLLLVPSVTIEQELTSKFQTLATDSSLNQLLENVGSTAPRIINGSESITPNSICIENRDAIYKNSRSSIFDSLTGKGERTLLLNDEVHHVYNTDGNKWKNFIKDYGENDINFKYIVGVSGTCYLGNDYFSDVIYRYSIRQAIEDNFIKTVEYTAEDDINDRRENDRWNVILESHNRIKESLPNGFNQLPISIVVTKDIKTCQNIADNFKQLLKEKSGLDDGQVNQKVLVVHSQASAANDRLRLKSVDQNDNQVEWIFSVSMLTEGWDVKRVFQIIPHEKRAFESKLLIAQVMGRGLRVPENWQLTWGQPKVRIFNHSNWASSVQNLVNEVIEIEERITARIDANSEYNFTLTNVKYRSEKNVIETRAENPYKWLEKGFVTLPAATEDVHHQVQFADIARGARNIENFEYTGRVYEVNEIVELLWSRFDDLDSDIVGEDGKNLIEHYKEKWPRIKLKEMVEKSLENSGNKIITTDLKERFLQSMGTLFRTGNKSVSYVSEPDEFFEVITKDMRNVSVSKSSLRNRSRVFYAGTPDQLIRDEKLLDGEGALLGEISDEFGEFRGAGKRIVNGYDFRTPQSVAIADSEPEARFIAKLTGNTTNSNIQKWIKSSNTSFYSFEYTWRKGEHPMRNSFNPDFFLLVGNRVIVAEIKGDEQVREPEPENKGKWRAAKKHFEVINEHLKTNCREHGELDIDGLQYKFTMLTPQSYDAFFGRIQSGDAEQLDTFASDLDVVIGGGDE